MPGPKASLTRKAALLAAREKAQAILASLSDELTAASWYKAGWLEQVLNQTMQNFDAACDRWRSLFLAARAQWNYQNAVIGDVARQPQWEEAKRLRREAESQIALLTDASNVVQSDFYSYRYFASEGFLPGYNFPRLPLSAFIPARKRMQGRDEFLSRPRFLAISEFGPRSIIYHEGSRYIVNKVILPVADGDGAITQSAKQCRVVRLLARAAPGEAGPDRCENCGQMNLERLDNLLRLQNVATKRRDRITSDEEERTRLGYEIRSGLRFKDVSGRARLPDGQGLTGDEPGSSIDLWRRRHPLADQPRLAAAEEHETGTVSCSTARRASGSHPTSFRGRRRSRRSDGAQDRPRGTLRRGSSELPDPRTDRRRSMRSFSPRSSPL